jgi:nucleotide-binding universal stress UspA family protein
MKRILVALDFSEVTEKLLAQACSLASAFEAELRFLHVAAPNPAFVGYEAGPQAVREQRAELLRREHRLLQDLAERARRRGIDAKAVLVQGPTVQTILEQAEKSEAELIVLGSHGHGMLYTALLGSVSEGVVRDARSPILLVPARDG